MLVDIQKSTYQNQDMLYNSIYNNIVNRSPKGAVFNPEVFDYTPELLVGILIHANLGDPKASRNFTYANNVYIDREKRGKFKKEEYDVETILRQDVIVELIDAAPKDMNIYSEAHSMFVGFETSFRGYKNACKEYVSYINELRKKYEYIRNSEINLIKKRRITKNAEELDELFGFLHENYSTIHQSLYQRFKKYDIDINNIK